MKALHSIKSNQHGEGLLDALIAVALSSFVILGALYSMGRMFVSQKQTNVQYIVINELRATLQNATSTEKAEWCSGTSHPTITLPKETSATDVTVTCKSMEVTVNNASNSSYNKTITETQLVKFEVDNALLGGKVTVGEELK